MLNRSSVLTAVAAAVLAACGGVAVAKDNPAAPKAPTVSKPLMKPLTAAQAATKAEKWAECLASAREADAFPTKTAYDTYAVNEMIGFCAVRSGDNATAAQSFEKLLESEYSDAARKSSLLRTLMQINYMAKNYPKAIEFGNRAIRDGSANDETRLITAQAYYLQPDYKGALAFLEGWVAETEKAAGSPSENALGLYLSSCIKLEDDACMLRALSKQAQYHPKPETSPNLVVITLMSAPPPTTARCRSIDWRAQSAACGVARTISRWRNSPTRRACPANPGGAGSRDRQEEFLRPEVRGCGEPPAGHGQDAGCDRQGHAGEAGAGGSARQERPGRRATGAGVPQLWPVPGSAGRHPARNRQG